MVVYNLLVKHILEVKSRFLTLNSFFSNLGCRRERHVKKKRKKKGGGRVEIQNVYVVFAISSSITSYRRML